MNKLLVVAATRAELEGLVDVSGVELLTCGVGPVEAAASVATRLATARTLGAVLHVGIAGCRAGSGLAIGDVVIGSAATYCDSANRLVVRHVDPDPALLATVRAALPGAHELPIGTSADVGGSSRAAAEDDATVSVEAMEGFAVLRAAARAGMPAVEVRVVSNEIEEADRARWDFAGALARLGELLPPLVEALAPALPEPRR